MSQKLIIPHIPFYFVRHGETEWNRIRQVMGSQDIPLNETGIAQATAAGEHLRGLRITKISSSPLARAKQTAEIINRHLDIDLDFHEGLRECRWGILEGGPRTDPRFASWAQGITPHEAEEYEFFHERVARAFATVLDPSHKSLIVSHSVVYRGLLRILDAQATDPKARNGAVYFFSPPDSSSDRWMVYALSDEK